MKDLPDIDEAFEAAVELTSEEPLNEVSEEAEEAPTEEAETNPEKEVEETPDDKAEPEAEETFVEKPDLSGKSSDEMDKIYKDWQKTYTQKRQVEKEEVRTLKERLADLEAKAPKNEKPIEQMSPQEFREYTLSQARRQVESERDNSYIESQEKTFYELDQRLDEDNPTFDEALFYSTVGKLTKEREAFEAENGSVFGFDFVGKAKGLIKAYDEAVKLKVQSYLTKNNEKARSKVNQSSKANPKANSASLKKAGGLDLDDAFKEALNEVGGTFNW